MMNASGQHINHSIAQPTELDHRLILVMGPDISAAQ